MKHKHRITPGHMGGKYTPENTIKVEAAQCNKSTATHPMWHFANWQLWGKEEDRIAWKGLAGLLKSEEVVYEALKLGGRKVHEVHPDLAKEQGGKVLLEKLGIHSSGVKDPERSEWGKMGGKATKEKHPNLAAERGKITFDKNPDQARKNGIKTLARGGGVFDNKNKEKVLGGTVEGARTTNNQKWMNTDPNWPAFVSNPGNLTQWQRSRGIDTSMRTRVG